MPNNVALRLGWTQSGTVRVKSMTRHAPLRLGPPKPTMPRVE